MTGLVATTTAAVPMRSAIASYAGAANGVGQSSSGQPDSGFGATLARAMEGVVDSAHAAEAKAMAGISGSAGITDVVAAVSKAELTLQTATAVRDRVVQAYQDIMRMPI